MIKMRKLSLALTAPFRAIRRRIGDLVNSSDKMPADWLRRNHYERNIDKLRRAGL